MIIYTKEKGKQEVTEQQYYKDIEPYIIHWQFEFQRIEKIGTLHREDGPAIEGVLQTRGWRLEEWWKDGKKHRLDGPAAIYIIKNGSVEEWWKNGLPHRIGSPAIISLGDKREHERWFQNGKLHREDGPADTETINGEKIKYWFINGKKHREDGPAIEGKRNYYYLDNETITSSQFKKIIKNIDKMDLTLQLLDEREWVRERAKKRKVKENEI